MMEVENPVRRNPSAGRAGELDQRFRGSDLGLLIGLVGKDRQAVLIRGIKGAECCGEIMVIPGVADVAVEPLAAVV